MPVAYGFDCCGYAKQDGCTESSTEGSSIAPTAHRPNSRTLAAAKPRGGWLVSLLGLRSNEERFAAF